MTQNDSRVSYIEALRLWVECEVACEDYDRTFPGHMGDGGTWIVHAPEHRAASIRFAQERMDQTSREAETIVHRESSERAYREAQDMPHSKRVAWLQTLHPRDAARAQP